MIPFSFTTTLFGQEVDVSVDIMPGNANRRSYLTEPQYPEAELNEVRLNGEVLDLDGVCGRSFGQDNYTPIIDKLERLAVEKWEESRG